MIESIQRVVTSIQDRLTEIEREERELEQALSHLTGLRDRRPRKAQRVPRQVPTQTLPRRLKRAAPGEREEQFLAAVGRRPGAPMTELAREIGVRPQQLYPIAKRLEAAGAISKGDASYVVR